jgi:hypothetical protein
MYKNTFTILIILFVSKSFAFQIQSSVNATSVAANQQIVLTIELTGDDANKVPQPSPPDLSSFLSYLGSGGSSQNIQVVNGKMAVTRSFTYYYMAKKPGSYTIPAMSISYKGKNATSKPIKITVLQQNQPRQQQKNQQTSSVNLYVSAIINKRKVYQNEPVIVTFRIYYKTQPSSYGVVKLPETTGFWAEEFEMGRSAVIGSQVINGQKWGTADIKKMALFPTSAGKLTIGPMKINCEVPVRGKSRDSFGFDRIFNDPFFNRTVRREVSSKKVDIEVLPLPAENRPAHFAGAVGKFNFTASVDKKTVKTNEAISLKVNISGTGNIHTVTAPVVDIPRDFEQYDPQESEKISKANNTVSGTKNYEYVLVPRFPGEQRIKPIKFSYFDPGAKKYVVLFSPEFIINVEKSSGDFVAPSGGLSKEEVRLVGQDIRFIKTTIQPMQQVGKQLFKSWIYMLLVIAPIFVLFVAIVQNRHLGKLEGNVAYARSRKANKEAMKRLSKAKSLLDTQTQKEYYAEVSKASIGFAADKLNLPAAGIISDELLGHFKNKNLSDTIISEYMDVIKICDYQRFAPANVSKSEMTDFFQKAKQAIINLDRAL